MAAKKKPSEIAIQTEPQNDTSPVVLESTVVTVIEEKERLSELERVIGTKLLAFYEVGYALKEIRDNQLYKVLDYKTFEDYCIQRWDMHRAHAYRLIDSSTIISNLSPIGDILPKHESQVRPLASLPPEMQREVWQKVVNDTATHEQAKITANIIKKAVAEIIGQDSESIQKEKPNIQTSLPATQNVCKHTD